MAEAAPLSSQDSPAPTPEKPPFSPLSNISNKVLIIAALVISLLLIGGALLYTHYYQKPSNLPSSTPQPTPLFNKSVDLNIPVTSENSKLIAKVGEENIYQRDLDIELLAYPKIKPLDQLKQFLLQKVASDSAILQGGKADGLITLDQTTFNSVNKDYAKRVKLIQDIKQKVAAQTNQISGTIISIWFFNDRVGSLGYDKAKSVAFDKISKLQSDVASGKITIDQAASQIQNDSSLAQLDTNYKGNAKYDFSLANLSLLDPNMKGLAANQASNVFIGKSSQPKTHQLIDAFYSFGVIKNIDLSKKITSFSDWFSNQKQKFSLQSI